MRLVIIGNGFDRSINLPTGYDDFREYLEANNKELFSCMEDIYDNGYLWSDFENALGKPNIQFLKRLDTLFSTDEIIDSSFVNKIKKIFNSWILSIDYSNHYPSKEYIIDNKSIYMSFNYTDTLSRIYGIDMKNIFFVHGYAGQTLYGENLIFGHNNTINELDLIRSTFKNTSEIIRNNLIWFKNLQLSNIDTIEIIGHSYNDIDYPYFQEIKKHCPKATWILHAHSTKDEKHRENYIKRLDLKKYVKEIKK